MQPGFGRIWQGPGAALGGVEAASQRQRDTGRVGGSSYSCLLAFGGPNVGEDADRDDSPPREPARGKVHLLFIYSFIHSFIYSVIFYIFLGGLKFADFSSGARIHEPSALV